MDSLPAWGKPTENSRGLQEERLYTSGQPERKGRVGGERRGRKGGGRGKEYRCSCSTASASGSCVIVADSNSFWTCGSVDRR